jgi:hypothetical protein
MSSWNNDNRAETFGQLSIVDQWKISQKKKEEEKKLEEIQKPTEEEKQKAFETLIEQTNKWIKILDEKNNQNS